MENNIAYECHLHQQDPAPTKGLTMETKILKIKLDASISFDDFNKKLATLFPILKETTLPYFHN